MQLFKFKEFLSWLATFNNFLSTIYLHYGIEAVSAKFLPATSAAPSPTLTWWWVCGDAGPCICHELHWLLQRLAGWCAERGDRQAATRNELCSMHRHEHAEVWPRFNARSTWYPSLAGCARTCHVCMEWGRCICRRCAGRSRQRLVVVTCVQLTMVNS